MNLPFFIAKRYLFSKKSHNAINIISAVSVISICVGTMALIVVLSAFNGLSDLVHSLYSSFNSDIQITYKEGKTFAPDSITLGKLREIKGVSYVTGIIEENALLKVKDQQCIATIRGVGKEYEKMSRIDTLVEDGTFRVQDKGQEYAVFGRGISYQLNANANDYFSPVSVFAPKRGIQASVNPEESFNEKKVYVSGVFSINDEFDDKYAIVSLDFARDLFDYKDEVTALELMLDPLSDKGKAQLEIQQLFGEEYAVKDRYQQNELLFKVLKSEKLWTFIILVFILVIATINVIGSLTMLMLEKKKDIIILWDMGASVKMLRQLFLFEGLLITFIGAVLGIVLGAFVCWLQIKFKLKRFDEGFIVDAYPIAMDAGDFAAVFAVVMFIGLLAAWYPVRIFTRKYVLRAFN